MGNLIAKVKSLLCKNSRPYRSIRRSGLFDYSFYSRQNPDVAQSGLDGLVHFISIGAREGRNPNPLFDLKHYQSQLTDQIQSMENPVLHYCRLGASAGLNPHPLFLTRFYQRQCEENAEPNDHNPLFHFLTQGVLLGLSPHPLFDYSFFQAQVSFDAQSQTNALIRYLSSAELWDIDPHPLFDVAYYKSNDPQVVSSGIAPLLYYLLNYKSSPIDPHPLFQGSWYRKELSGEVEQEMNPLVHYLMYGQYEGKNPFKVKLNQNKAERERSAGQRNIISSDNYPSRFLDPPRGKAGKKSVSVIVWGDSEINLAVLVLQKILQSVSSVDWDIVICSSRKENSVQDEHDESLLDKICPIHCCHSLLPLAQILQKASAYAQGEIFVFLQSEVILKCSDSIEQFFTYIVQQKTGLVCCNGVNSRRQRINYELLQEIFGIHLSGIFKRQQGEEQIVPTIECMAVRRDLFIALHGFIPLYEQYYFELDFVLKALAAGVEQIECLDLSFVKNIDSTIVTDQSACNIDKLLFLDSCQEQIGNNFPVSRDCFNLVSYMNKKRNDILRKKRSEEERL